MLLAGDMNDIQSVKNLCHLFPKILFQTGRELIDCIKDDMQRFFTKLMQKSYLAAYCNINPSV